MIEGALVRGPVRPIIVRALYPEARASRIFERVLACLGRGLLPHRRCARSPTPIAAPGSSATGGRHCHRRRVSASKNDEITGCEHERAPGTPRHRVGERQALCRQAGWALENLARRAVVLERLTRPNQRRRLDRDGRLWAIFAPARSSYSARAPAGIPGRPWTVCRCWIVAS